MEENRKKILILTIIAVVTLILVTVGATFAYFMAQVVKTLLKMWMLLLIQPIV